MSGVSQLIPQTSAEAPPIPSSTPRLRSHPPRKPPPGSPRSCLTAENRTGVHRRPVGSASEVGGAQRGNPGPGCSVGGQEPVGGASWTWQGARGREPGGAEGRDPGLGTETRPAPPPRPASSPRPAPLPRLWNCGTCPDPPAHSGRLSSGLRAPPGPGAPSGARAPRPGRAFPASCQRTVHAGAAARTRSCLLADTDRVVRACPRL